MLQTFCYLCIKKPLTLPHTPLRLLKHRTKNTYEPQKARTRRTNHKKNDQKYEPKERPKARTQTTNHEKNDQKHEPKERTTKRTTKRTNPKNEPRKERPKARTPRTNHEKNDRKARAQSTNPAPMFQARLTAPVFASPPIKATKHSKRP